MTDSYDGGPYYSNGSNSSAFRGEIGLAANSDDPLVDLPRSSTRRTRRRSRPARRTTTPTGSSWTTARAGPTRPPHMPPTPSRGSRATTRCVSVPVSPSTTRSCSRTASTPGGSFHRDRSSGSRPASPSSRTARPLPSRWRQPQTGHLQCAELLPDHWVRSSSPVVLAPAPTTPTGQGHASRTTAAIPTGPAVQPTTPTWDASAPRLSPRSTPRTPTSCRWRSWRTR